jgi:uncharacterized hydrophobic protein (TIGR00271 family)
VIQIRVVCPSGLAATAIGALERSPSVLNLIHVPGAARKPAGDVIVCDVPREEASIVLAGLEALGVGAAGTVTLENVVSGSERARAAEVSAPGTSGDAVVWEELEARTSESTELSIGYLVFMVAATLIAAAGILTDSVILIIGAMVVGPEFGPLAGLCVAAIAGQRALALRSLTALVAGFVVAIAAALAGTLLARLVDLAPDDLSPDSHPETMFISDPNWWSVVVALLAGVAGMLSLTSAKSGALIGVLISVTTIPAAANVGVAAAYGDWSTCGGASGQLAINLVAIVAASLATLSLQRIAFRRRLASARRGAGAR